MIYFTPTVQTGQVFWKKQIFQCFFCDHLKHINTKYLNLTRKILKYLVAIFFNLWFVQKVGIDFFFISGRIYKNKVIN